MLLVRPGAGQADWAWDFYNNDGSVAEMCGNGARCFARFVQRLTGVKDGFSFETKAGIIAARFQGETVTINLTAPRDLRLNESLPLSVGQTVVHSVGHGRPARCRLHAGRGPGDGPVPGRGDPPPPALCAARHEREFRPTSGRRRHSRPHLRARGGRRDAGLRHRGDGVGPGGGRIASVGLGRCGCRVQGGNDLEVSFEKSVGRYVNVCLTGPADFVFDGRITL